MCAPSAVTVRSNAPQVRHSSALTSATGRAAHGEAQLRRGAIIVVVAGTHDRPHGTGVEQSVTNETLVDMDSDNLTEYHMAVGWTAIIVGEGDGLHPLALKCARRCRDPRRLDEPRRRRRQPAFFHFIDAARKRCRGLIDLLAQFVGREIA